jgi:hypothetical protein
MLQSTTKNKRPLARPEARKKPKPDIWAVGKPDFPKYVLQGISPFLSSKELHALMHASKALHANIRRLDSHWNRVLERISLCPGQRHRPYDFLARLTKSNPVKMCVCNREPVNTGAKDHNGQKISNNVCWLCAVQPVSKQVSLDIAQVFPRMLGDPGPIRAYLSQVLTTDKPNTYNVLDRNILAELAKCCQSSHPNKRGLYPESFMARAFQNLLGVPVQMSIQGGCFRLGDFVAPTTLQDVRTEYFQLCRRQFHDVLGIEITEEPAIPLVCSVALQSVALGSFLDPLLLLTVLKMQQKLHIAPVAGVPPLALVMQRLLATRDADRFRQLCTVVEHRIIRSDRHYSQDSDYVEQCLQLWIDGVVRDLPDPSDLRRLYHQTFKMFLRPPKTADYNTAAVKMAVHNHMQPLFEKVQMAANHIRVGVFTEMAKMAPNAVETTPEVTAWVRGQVNAGSIIRDIFSVFKPLQWYDFVQKD